MDACQPCDRWNVIILFNNNKYSIINFLPQINIVKVVENRTYRNVLSFILNIQPRCTCLFFYTERHVSIILSACIFNISDQICLGTWVTNIMSCAPWYYSRILFLLNRLLHRFFKQKFPA